MAGKLDGLGLAALAAGGLLTYSGITGKGVLSGVQGLIQGKAPATAAAANPITGQAAVGITGPTPPGSDPAIAQDALKYVGAGYVWGGAPANGIGNWDCSSFVNWVIGHDLGRAIPLYKAGTYTGANHGPPTTVWLAWTGATTLSHKASDAQAGDLCIWQTHMGIAIGGGRMVSARSASSNPPTGIDTIAGDIPGELLFIRRLKPGG